MISAGIGASSEGKLAHLIILAERYMGSTAIVGIRAFRLLDHVIIKNHSGFLRLFVLYFGSLLVCLSEEHLKIHVMIALSLVPFG
jgi:hypothetical protein